MNINYNITRFLTSSVDAQCFGVQKDGIEIAFIGYSNSGKSTLINSLTRNKKLSRFSKFPGRTSMINFFWVNKKLRLVDLPGYGYSEIYKNKKKNYDLIFNYIKYRTCLKGVFLLIDIRRLLREEDLKFLKFIKKYMNIVILLTKCDKMNFSYQIKQMNILKKQVHLVFKDVEIILLSSRKYIGITNILDIISNWFYTFLDD